MKFKPDLRPMLYEAICNLLQDQDLVVCQPDESASLDPKTCCTVSKVFLKNGSRGKNPGSREYASYYYRDRKVEHSGREWVISQEIKVFRYYFKD